MDVYVELDCMRCPWRSELDTSDALQSGFRDTYSVIPRPRSLSGVHPFASKHIPKPVISGFDKPRFA